MDLGVGSDANFGRQNRSQMGLPLTMPAVSVGQAIGHDYFRKPDTGGVNK